MARTIRPFAIHARSIYRKSRNDPGRLGVWLVMAPDAAAAEGIWRTDSTITEWVFESVETYAKPIIRML
jgi:hypothetical protein